MKPYFDDGKGRVIYHGDCREILPTLPKCDLVLTDPPYGINYVHGSINIPNATRFASVPVLGDDEPFDPTVLFNRAADCFIWGANHFSSSLPHGRWHIWDKRCQVVPQRDQSDCEIAWSSTRGPDRIFYHVWDGFLKDSERGVRREHPTQKPIALMNWCFSFFPKAQTVLDPFMGSGTTLRAAKDLNLACIGIELEEKYCEIAARRLEQEVFEFKE